MKGVILGLALAAAWRLGCRPNVASEPLKALAACAEAQFASVRLADDAEKMLGQIRLSYSGYGLAALRYVSVVDRLSCRVPSAVLGRTSSRRWRSSLPRHDLGSARDLLLFAVCGCLDPFPAASD